jgi:UDP-glucose 4-epimerase
VPDCTRARQQIGFLPSRSLEDIIQDVTAYQQAASPEVPLLAR